jgi:hypothetical protein
LGPAAQAPPSFGQDRARQLRDRAHVRFRFPRVADHEIQFDRRPFSAVDLAHGFDQLLRGDRFVEYRPHGIGCRFRRERKIPAAAGTERLD